MSTTPRIAIIGAGPGGLVCARVLQRHRHDRTVEEFDLVIGADGAWSGVRPALSDAQPSYAGVTMVEAHFDDVDRRHPGIARLVGAGTMSAKAGRRSLILQRNSNGHM